MPKVYLTKEEKLNSKLVALIYGTMKVKHITQAQMGEKLFITQQGFAKKLKTAQFTFQELVKIFDILEFTDEQIISVLRERRGA